MLKLDSGKNCSTLKPRVYREWSSAGSSAEVYAFNSRGVRVWFLGGLRIKLVRLTASLTN